MNYPGYPLYPNHIRVITLLPGRWNDKIHCTLRQEPLSETPHYEALSYVWGSKGAMEKIWLNGKAYDVTFNLYCALRRLRNEKLPKTLWVDALCINQDDTSERTHQVGIMGRIYTLCATVIVYLGEGSSDTNGPPRKSSTCEGNTVEYFGDDRDLDQIRPFTKGYTHLRASNHDITFDPLPAFALVGMLSRCEHIDELPVFKGAKHNSAPRNRVSQVLEALRCMMNNPCTPWWSRIWVVQEVVLPPEVKIVYGRVSAPWRMFADAAVLYTHHARTCCAAKLEKLPRDSVKVMHDFSDRILGIERLRRAYKSDNSRQGERSLLSLLTRFRDRQATDPRDKVYALLSLVQYRPDQTPMIPDYSLSEVDVFRDATLTIISHTASLSILNTNFSRKFRNDLPTWVPDWGAPGDYASGNRADTLELYNSWPTDQALVCTIDREKRFSVLAKPLGRLKNLGDVMWFDDGSTMRDTLSKWLHSYFLRVETETRSLERICRLLCADVLTIGPTEFRRTQTDDGYMFLAWALVSEKSPIFTGKAMKEEKKHENHLRKLIFEAILMSSIRSCLKIGLTRLFLLLKQRVRMISDARVELLNQIAGFLRGKALNRGADEYARLGRFLCIGEPAPLDFLFARPHSPEECDAAFVARSDKFDCWLSCLFFGVIRDACCTGSMFYKSYPNDRTDQPIPLDSLFALQALTIQLEGLRDTVKDSLREVLHIREDLSDFSPLLEGDSRRRMMESIYRVLKPFFKKSFDNWPHPWRFMAGTILSRLDDLAKKELHAAARNPKHKWFLRLDKKVLEGVGPRYPALERDAMIIDHSIMTATIGRRLMITEDGYVGLGPAESRYREKSWLATGPAESSRLTELEEGDELFLLYGARTPFILRRTRKYERIYKMVGDCYMDGLMDAGANLRTRWGHDHLGEIIVLE